MPACRNVLPLAPASPGCPSQSRFTTTGWPQASTTVESGWPNYRAPVSHGRKQRTRLKQCYQKQAGSRRPARRHVVLSGDKEAAYLRIDFPGGGRAVAIVDWQVAPGAGFNDWFVVRGPSRGGVFASRHGRHQQTNTAKKCALVTSEVQVQGIRISISFQIRSKGSRLSVSTFQKDVKPCLNVETRHSDMHWENPLSSQCD